VQRVVLWTAPPEEIASRFGGLTLRKMREEEEVLARQHAEGSVLDEDEGFFGASSKRRTALGSLASHDILAKLRSRGRRL
jgi:hypothetical protein